VCLGIVIFGLLIWMGARMLRVTARPRTNSENSPLTTVTDVPLPGAAVRFDYQSLDQKAGRLYISHMNANQLVVVDVKRNQVVANLDGFPRVHGVWAVPDVGRVYASTTGEHKVAVVDMQSLKTIARVGPVEYPDGLAYAAIVERVFVSDERGGVDAVIDAKSNSLLKNIPLGGGAGNTIFDASSGNILVAIHKKNGPFRPLSPAPGLLRQVMCRLFYHPDERIEPVAIDQPLTPGEILPIAGGIEVVHTPGHCAGQVALLWRPGRMLFAGDVCMNVIGLGDPVGFESLKEGRASQRTVASLDSMRPGSVMATYRP
jgi:hypothetical protein